MFYMRKSLADQRDQILFGENYNENKYFGGIRHYSGLGSDNLELLLKLGFADKKEKQNDAPSIGEVARFLSKHPNFTAHGYSVSPERDDHRVSVEGIECGKGYTLSDIQDFFSLLKHAPDTLRVNEDELYCWFT